MLGAFIHRRVSVLACAIATAALGVEFSMFGQSASATDPTTNVNLLTCPGSVTVTFHPGLTLIPQQTTFNPVGSVSPCETLGSTINAGTFDSKSQAISSCLLNSTGPFTITYKWDNGNSSTVLYDATVNVRGAAETVFTSTGTVVYGEYAGARAVLTNTTATLSPTDCATPGGVTSITGVLTLTFVGPLNLLP